MFQKESDRTLNRMASRRQFLHVSGMAIAAITIPGLKHANAVSELSDQANKLLSGVTWFKQSGFRVLDGEKVIYFDPYQLSENTHDADLILVSHSHNDHCDASSISKIVKNETQLITEPESATKLKSLVSEITTVSPGETITVDGIKIQAIASYNINKTNHPKSKNYLGFLVTLRDGRRFYHAGDTDKIPEMDNLEPDVAMLPCAGTYTMNASEAAEAAKGIHPKLVVPMHYGSAVGSVRDAQTVQDLLSGIIEVVIFDPGQTIEPIKTHVELGHSLSK